MLVEFRVENFRSIREEQVLSLVASTDKSHPENVIEVAGFRLLKAAGIYGANASGKTNIIRAFREMNIFVNLSATAVPGHALPNDSFLFDDDWASKPSKFEVTIIKDEIRYQYGFSVDGNRVLEEWLWTYPKKYSRLLFQRKYQKDKDSYSWKHGDSLKGNPKSLESKTRKDSLFLSVGAHWNNEQLMNVFSWFNDDNRTVLDSAELKDVTASFLVDETPDSLYHELMVSALSAADVGICGTSVSRGESIEIQFPQDMPQDRRDEIAEKLRDRTEFNVRFNHTVRNGSEDKQLAFKDESRGTQRFFRFLGPWYSMLSFGYKVWVDELASSFHPFMTKALLELVLSDDTNSKGAQVIFTTHDTTLMNSEMFRRDQIWFTEKNHDGATELYSLSDYKPRKDEAFQRGYLGGRYGAIPIIESFGFHEPQES